VSSAEMVLGEPLCCRASHRAAAAASVVLQERAIGGPNLTRPLPPAQSGLPAALAACSSIYVMRGGNL
jgi:hypothetical protein